MKESLKEQILTILNNEINSEDIKIEYPKDRSLGDYAIPCFNFARILKKSPQVIAEELLEKIDCEGNAINGYLNIFLNKKVYCEKIINKIFNEQNEFGNNNLGAGKNLVIEYSSPNVAKPFGVGHLRSTAIGESLKRISEKCGYNVTTINYLGDYGTQFGKLIYAYLTWGDPEAIKKSMVSELKRVYVKFHEESEKNPELDDYGRTWFKRLEDNDPEALKYWQWFKEESIKEFNKTYDLLNINKFDSYEGESYYKDKMQPIIDELEKKNLLTISEGATVVDFGNETPALIKRSDGATLYITRDIAAVFDRKKRYNFDEILYVVGNEQTLHFEHIKKIITMMGYNWADQIKHINFGMVLQGGKKMSTRHGKSVELQGVLDETIEMSKQHIIEKNSSLENKDEVARKVGVGAVLFNDLKNYRINDVEFNLEDLTKFEGNTGPYLQYTYARIKSLLNNKQNIKVSYDSIEINDYIWNIIWQLYKLEETIINAKENNDPSLIAKYVLDLTGLFNKLYAQEKIIDDDLNYSTFKLNVCEVTSIVIKECLNLLNIETIDKM